MDDYHVGDPLFLADLGRRLSKLGQAGRIVIIHRVGEVVSRGLENADPADKKFIVERTIRETNQGITRRLIEEGVPAVSIQGSDRGLFRMGSDGTASSGSWLLPMIKKGTIPVISPLAAGREAIEEANPTDCAVAIAGLMGRETVAAIFCSTRKAGLFRDGSRLETEAIADLSKHAETIDMEAAVALVRVVDCLVATNSVGAGTEPDITGTIITA